MKVMSIFKKISVIIAGIALFSDLVTIAFFLESIFTGDIKLTFDLAFTRAFIIVLIFSFSIVLLTYSEEGDNKIFGLFGWLYVLLSALMLAGISYRFITESNYGLYEYVGYIILIFLTMVLGVYVSKDTGIYRMNFSIPFMIVGIEQMVLWILIMYSKQTIMFDSRFGANILLLIIIILFIHFLKSFE